MATETTPPLLERVQSSYKRLSAVASQLNTASDELGKSVASLDEALKTLNLGIASWYKFAGSDNDDGSYWAKYIGYVRIGSRWGIGLRKTSGHDYAPPDYNSDEEWLFNDAPRQLRIEAVEHIPAMIEQLITAAEAAVENIKAKSAEARQLAEVLGPKKPKSDSRNLLVQPR